MISWQLHQQHSLQTAGFVSNALAATLVLLTYTLFNFCRESLYNLRYNLTKWPMPFPAFILVGGVLCVNYLVAVAWCYMLF